MMRQDDEPHRLRRSRRGRASRVVDHVVDIVGVVGSGNGRKGSEEELVKHFEDWDGSLG